MRVLACGGSADGEWIELAEGTREFRRLKPHVFNWAQTDKVDTEIDYEIYRIWSINLLGYGMKVATLADGSDPESGAVLKALVRRDVHAHLTNPEGRRGG